MKLGPTMVRSLFSQPIPLMKFEQTTFPLATNVVSLAQAKAHLRVEHSDDETLIETLIGVAQNVVEGYTGRFLQQVEGAFYFDDFHEFMNLHVGRTLRCPSTGRETRASRTSTPRDDKRSLTPPNTF